MAYERNIFRSVGPGSHILGSVLEYNSLPGKERGPNWKIPVLAVLSVSVLVSLIYARFVSDDDDPVVRNDAVAYPAAVSNSNDKAESLEPKAADTRAAVQAREWAGNAELRPARERALLERLADAERLGRYSIAIDTIEQLRSRPEMADLDDKLSRRLGELNVEFLMSGEATPWTTETVVRRGQTVHRIARNHGTTVAAVRLLNGLKSEEEPEVGRSLRVLRFPRAALVVHKSTRHADLSLNGKLFKRYYISISKETLPGSYPVTRSPNEGPRSRFAELGIKVVAQDMKEIDMFLAPGSSLVVSEM